MGQRWSPRDFWVPFFQTSPLFLTGSEANPMLELMTSKHEDPPGDAMPCDFAQGKKTWIHPQSRSVLLIGWSMKKKQSVISNCLTHYNASYNPNYYPKSQSFPICYTFWSLPLPQSMRSRRVRFFLRCCRAMATQPAAGAACHDVFFSNYFMVWIYIDTQK